MPDFAMRVRRWISGAPGAAEFVKMLRAADQRRRRTRPVITSTRAID
jgi:hypothetical protein